MSELLLCRGKRAVRPYYIASLGINIFSIEELCYLISQNAHTLDHDFMEEELCRFVREQLGLTELADALKEIIRGKGALTDFIMNELGRGVSSIEITGEYTGDKRKQLKILCSPRESFLIKRHLAKYDPKSFVSVISVKSVWGVGRGFSDIRDIDS